jgi:site-specific recombinase XerD
LAIATFIGEPGQRGHRGAVGPSGEWRSYLGQKSPHTRAAYSYALTEFFEWVARKYGRVVAPEDVTRMDAADYVTYLANPRFNLAIEKVHDNDPNDHTGAKKIKEAIVDILSRKGRLFFLDLMKQLAIVQLQNPELVEKQLRDDETLRREYRWYLGDMVIEEILKTKPTVSELRNEEVTTLSGAKSKPYSQLGISLWDKDGVPYEFLFSYEIAERKTNKQSTVAVRVSALSSFWQSLSRGENIPGGAPLLQYDIWTDQKRNVNKEVGAQKRVAADKKLLSAEEVFRMLKIEPHRMTDYRNRAMLYLLAYTGIRASELLQLRFGKPRTNEVVPCWFDADEQPRVIHVTRKGLRQDVIPFPELAHEALWIFYGEVKRRAASWNAQKEDSRLPNYLPPDEPGWLYRELGKEGTPLFPSLAEWGANQAHHGKVRHLTRDALAKILKSMSEAVGFTIEQVKRVHPHAFRHFFATAAFRGGIPLEELKARMHHADIRTTQGYIAVPEAASRTTAEEQINRHLEETLGDSPRGGRGAPPPGPRPPPKPREDIPQVPLTPGRSITPIDVQGVEVKPSK